MTLSMSFKSKLNGLHYRGSKRYEYVCPLTLGMESYQSMRYQDNFFCNLVTPKGELIEKVLPTLSNDKTIVFGNTEMNNDSLDAV